MSLSIKYWGVRGSLPASPSPDDWTQHIEGILRGFFNAGLRDSNQISKYIDSLGASQLGGYGAATTCVEITSAKARVIIDGGSGIRGLSEQMMSGKAGTSKGPFHIFMTHFHWDHVIGLPFFAPHFMSGVQIHYYAVQADLEKLIRRVFEKPYFPVPFEALGAKIHFHILEPRKPLKIDDITITPYQLDHPDPCWGYRIENNGKVYSHCVDTEGTRISRDELGDDLPLYQNVDLMYYDAQYTFPELAEKSNWGHSASQVGLDLAFREGIKRVLFAHHDPGASIQNLQDLRRQTLEYYDWRLISAKENLEELAPVEWEFAYEGQIVKI